MADPDILGAKIPWPTKHQPTQKCLQNFLVTCLHLLYIKSLKWISNSFALHSFSYLKIKSISQQTAVSETSSNQRKPQKVQWKKEMEQCLLQYSCVVAKKCCFLLRFPSWFWKAVLVGIASSFSLDTSTSELVMLHSHHCQWGKLRVQLIYDHTF